LVYCKRSKVDGGDGQVGGCRCRGGASLLPSGIGPRNGVRGGQNLLIGWRRYPRAQVTIFTYLVISSFISFLQFLSFFLV